MPQLDISTYPPQLVWLLITFVALYLVVWKVALPRIVDVRESRQRRIEDDLGKAETLRTEAETVLAALEKSHADAAAEAQGIHRETAHAIGEARTKLQEETAARLAEETQAAEQRIADEQAAARETIPEVAGDVTRAAVERLTGASVADTDVQSAVNASWRGGA
ncbi:MAG: F0F1 ATP synthase subunit B' [Pseudomonadota bacterium]|nr:F0F1 ATP synthase subunit B' [Pseudomonadota bacterium]MEC8700380.1 F0F1 ATP synthase subunit B' [Pseudomonadota bacterium]